MSSAPQPTEAAGQGGYDIVPFRPEHADAAARLHTIVSATDPRINAAYLTWKYGRNPYLGWRYLYVALHAGEIVGMRGFYGSRWEIGNEAYVVPCGGDLVIDVKHRNRSLATRLTRRAMNDLSAGGFPCAFSLSAIPVSALSLMALGWKAVAPVGELKRMRALPLHTLWRCGKSLASGLLGRRKIGGVVQTSRSISRPLVEGVPVRQAHFRHLDAATGRERNGIRVEQSAEPEAMAALIRRLGHDGSIRHVRDSVYLGWRFDNPMSDYRFLYAGRGDGLEGYLVLRASRFARQSDVSIVDWEARTRDAKRALLRSALELGKFSSLSTWSLGLDRESQALLEECGFVSEGGEGITHLRLKVLVKMLGSTQQTSWTLGGTPLLSPERWQMRMVYSDWC